MAVYLTGITDDEYFPIPEWLWEKSGLKVVKCDRSDIPEEALGTREQKMKEEERKRKKKMAARKFYLSRHPGARTYNTHITAEERAAIHKEQLRAGFQKYMKMRQLEHQMQVACVTWCRLQHPKAMIFAVPNGGLREGPTAVKLKAEGLLPGVSDLILLEPRGEYHALLIEMKTSNGRQSPQQKNFQAHAEESGYKYVICRSLEEFMTEVNAYLDLR